MHHIPYQSRSTLHKTPFGAVAAGTEITFRLVLPRELGCQGLWLCWGDYDGAWANCEEFEWEALQGDWEEWWQCRLKVEEPGLYRYRFSYDNRQGGGWIGNEGGGIARAGEESYWQLTVYEKEFALPQWVSGGIMYQIFPDRFFRGEAAAPPDAAQGSERLLREDWGGEPFWNPDARGRIAEYDFFGGNLRGIAAKVGYLQSLGVTCIYLNPIFLASSNHRYDTADYLRIDPLLGDEEALRELCAVCRQAGIRIILDGVFSHTGADSVYFNKFHHFPGPGAYESRESPYYGWYTFRKWPQDYESWWGIDILPELRETNEGVLEFFTGSEGVARRWLRAGAAGWRLDVADELPDVFLDRLFAAAREEKPDAYLLGEVWEDASCKFSHGGRRRFLLGGQMHSVMNYPLADAIIAFVRKGCAERLAEVVMMQQENYPPAAIDGLMNHIGTHDTLRALTRLGLEDERPVRREPIRLMADQLASALEQLKLCAALQYTLPGNPCVYYGDEAGLQGGMDPYNRACFPWGCENGELLAYYRELGKFRRAHAAFAGGAFRLLSAALGCVAFLRVPKNKKDGSVLVIANANPHKIEYKLPPDLGGVIEVPGVGAVMQRLARRTDSRARG
ncbi:MAG: glycoside hydrolase family 13 protein [Oscillospiraceae bacterium]|jgi:glycosidase|nr:glycoside hydrolase family 13 protein [Oscillospiraceae bacterium]